MNRYKIMRQDMKSKMEFYGRLRDLVRETKRICVECGKIFNPIWQGHEEDVSCIKCIDKRNM